MQWKRYAIAFSVVTSIAALGWAGLHGLNFGIDFKGGSAIEVQAQSGVADPGTVRQLLTPLDLGEVQVQNFGTPEDLLVRIELQPGPDSAQQEAIAKVTDVLSQAGYDVRRTESISGTVSGELAMTGTIGLTIAMVGVLLYLWFREWQFAVGAIIATAHDVISPSGSLLSAALSSMHRALLRSSPSSATR